MFYILAHDLGTSGDKAVLFSENGDVFASEFSAYETKYPCSGWVEQDPEDYWRAFCESTKSIMNKNAISAKDIACVVFSAQMGAAIPVDDSGKALSPAIIWADRRAVDINKRIEHAIPSKQFYRITGNRPDISYSAPKIMWIRENQSEVYEKADVFLQVKDFVVQKLTRTICTDYSDATATNLMDIETLKWSDVLLDITGIYKKKLPEPVESTTIVGKVQRDAAGDCGLLQGTPVVIGGGDGACATCGAGVVKTGDMYFNIGTSSWIGFTTDKPFLDPKMRVFNFSHLMKGKYCVIGAMQCGGGSVSWFIDSLCSDMNESAIGANEDIYEYLTRQAADISAGCDGLIFLPYLMGERSPIWNPHARGTFIGLTMSHKKTHLFRAVLEGVAYHMRSIMEVFEEQGTVPIDIRAIGGGVNNKLWLSIFSDILERTVLTLTVADNATSVGACIAGAVGIGLYKNIEEGARTIKIKSEVKTSDIHRANYRRNYSAFRKSYTKLTDIFTLLSH